MVLLYVARAGLQRWNEGREGEDVLIPTATSSPVRSRA